MLQPSCRGSGRPARPQQAQVEKGEEVGFGQTEPVGDAAQLVEGVRAWVRGMYAARRDRLRYLHRAALRAGGFDRPIWRQHRRRIRSFDARGPSPAEGIAFEPSDEEHQPQTWTG